MRRATWLLLPTAIVPTYGTDATRVPLHRGLFALTNTTNWVVKDGKRVNLFDYEVDGVVNYLTWRGFEPERGKLNTRGFVRMMDEAKAADKLVALNVIPGTHAPDWVFGDLGVEPYEMVRSGKVRRTYLPWVEVGGKRQLNTKMLAVWGETVKAYAKMIHEHPERSRIHYVAITGWPEPGHVPLETQLKCALDLGATWVQLWHHDIIREECQPALREYRSLFSGR